jgi:hypothetical protein
VKTKNRGRIDARGKWEGIKIRWLNSYRNREVVDGLSLMREVNADEEWCAEAYMEIDYSTLTQDQFEKEVKRFVLYNLMLETQNQTKDEKGIKDAT